MTITAENRWEPPNSISLRYWSTARIAIPQKSHQLKYWQDPVFLAEQSGLTAGAAFIRERKLLAL